MTQNNIRGLVALGVVAVLAFGAVALWQGSQNFGGGAYEALPKWFGNGMTAGTAQQLAIDSSGNLTIANASATSTIAAGCLQLNATSSATNVKLVLSRTGATSTFAGTAYWSYGTCP